jgi:CTP synthase
LNIDAGVLSPYEHGEVYVLDDGGEVDLDLGNYERFLNITLTKDHNLTTGKIYSHVIQAEREGKYLGKTVQVIPHITDAIQEWIARVASIPVEDSKTIPDVCIIELGGTVGDIESMVFLEALRQLRFSNGKDNLCHVHISLVPIIGDEPKSKPTQHSMKDLRSAGLSPDLIVCRSKTPVPRSVVSKISLFCMVPVTHVLSVPDSRHLYEVPWNLFQQQFPHLILASLRINKIMPEDMPEWRGMLDRVLNPLRAITVTIVGKYTAQLDSYLSLRKALLHAGTARQTRVNEVWVEASLLEAENQLSNPESYANEWKKVREADALLVPGGFGVRGIEGMIKAIEFARTNNVPFLGICLGMQMAVCEFARNVLQLPAANSEEFAPNGEHKLIVFMPEVSKTHMGGTMRLGSRTANITDKKSLAYRLYGSSARERHRHRYEVNPEYVPALEQAGLLFSGKVPLS